MDSPEITKAEVKQIKNFNQFSRTTDNEDLTGRRFGKLTVQGRERGKNWICICDCGNQKVVPQYKLLGGRMKSCGCAQNEGHPRLDYTGMRFGKLLVLGEADRHVGKNGDKRRQWRCRCDCGNEVTVLQTSLQKGATTSCGCLQRVYWDTDLTGERFGKLNVEGPADPGPLSGSTLWRCRCDCGNEKEYTTTILLSGRVCSCGCYQEEQKRQRAEDNVFDLYEGTNISRIKKQTLQKNNTSGVRGVHKMLGPTPKDDRWIAMIGVQRKRIYLGCFHSLEDAIKARKVAEEQYHQPLIEDYEATEAASN